LAGVRTRKMEKQHHGLPGRRADAHIRPAGSEDLPLLLEEATMKEAKV